MEITKTHGEFIIDAQHEHPDASGELSSLFASIRLAAKIVHREINKAGLADITGAAGAENVQGEAQQKLNQLHLLPHAVRRFQHRLCDLGSARQIYEVQPESAWLQLNRRYENCQ